MMASPLTRIEASPLLLFSLLGLWGVHFLLRNQGREDAFHTLRGQRFYKRHAPRWFLAWTWFYLTGALGFIVLPIWLIWMIRP